MLLKYGAKNFYCFKEGIEVSFELGPNCPETISKGKKHSSVICVKGANGSGKTNVLKALSFLGEFCSKSFAAKPDDEISINSFFDSPESIELFVEYEISEIKYRYEIALTRKAVITETLFKKVKRFTKIIERKENRFVLCVDDYKDLKSVKLRSNVSFISTANQYEIAEISSIYKFFKTIWTNVHSFGFLDFEPDVSDISRYYHDNEDTFEFAKNVIYQCDLGVVNIVIHMREDENGKKLYYPLFYHKTGNKRKRLTFQSQSSGTKALFYRLGIYDIALRFGDILVMDEIDIHLHPHILPVLLDLFLDDKKNTYNAQLIITTHNDAIMDFLGKYRTIFVNKEDNESYCYRLDEIPGDVIRNDRLISPIYNAGKIGGVPKL